jgi:hypothetical protein
MFDISVCYQVLILDEDLESIERLVRRVEVANGDSIMRGPSGVIVTSAAPMGQYSALEGVPASRASLMVELIQQYGDLSSAIEKQSSKAIAVQVDFPTDDFPKETAERLEIISRCDKYSHALAVKDHILWTALKDKEKAEEALEAERKLSFEYAQELSQWAELSQNVQQQLRISKNENENLHQTNLYLINLLRENNIYFSPS